MAVVYRGAGAHFTPGAFTSVTSITLDLPAGTAVGDLLIAQLHASNVYPLTTWGATGWTTIPVAAGTNPSTITSGSDASPLRYQTLYRVADGSEGATATFTKLSGGNTAIIGKISGWFGVDGTTPFDATGIGHHPGGDMAAIDVPALTTVTDGAVGAILLLSMRQPSPPSGWTEQSETSNNGYLSTHTFMQATAGPLDPGSLSLTGFANKAAAFYVLLRPAAGGGPAPVSSQPPYAVLVG